ncbi:M24 family metallopeptidase [Rathayibacter soli]|uniref:M24 family metallopeptidase n=1 Tax=Rathayibacter soli TaxID=3144168 RepID=UPI0027E3E82D|nr:Xaa-Pro peptidase family protein [Glaciibacter superstes]
MSSTDPVAIPRIARVQRALGLAHADLLVATDYATVQWLCGHSVSAGTVVFVDDDSSDAVVSEPGVDHLEALRASAPYRNLGAWSVVAIETSAAPGWLLKLLAGHPLVDLRDDLAMLRAVKDSTELGLIMTAAKRASDAQRVFRSEIECGLRERELSDTIQMRLAKEGNAVSAVVDLMFGDRCMLVGAAPTGRVLTAADTAIFDFAPVVEDYWADSCSTVVVGRPSRDVLRLHGTIQRALEAGIALLRPGTRISDVDKSVRSIMGEAGYHYPHLTGHGVGLKQQEYPFVASDSDYVLEADIVIALEPGAYFDEYGARLEHLIHVTEDGPRVLTTHSVELAAR